MPKQEKNHVYLSLQEDLEKVSDCAPAAGKYILDPADFSQRARVLGII